MRGMLKYVACLSTNVSEIWLEWLHSQVSTVWENSKQKTNAERRNISIIIINYYYINYITILFLYILLHADNMANELAMLPLEHMAYQIKKARLM